MLTDDADNAEDPAFTEHVTCVPKNAYLPSLTFKVSIELGILQNRVD